MVGRKRGIAVFAYVTFWFFAFGGYYCVLAMQLNGAGLAGEGTRIVTIPVRMLMLACLVLAFYRQPKALRAGPDGMLFGVFSVAYALSILHSDLTSQLSRMSSQVYLGYFFGFVVLPFMLISKTAVSPRMLRLSHFSICCSIGLFSLIVVAFYGSIIGSGRLSGARAELEGVNYLSPLAMSYCGSMGLALCSSYMAFVQASRRYKVLCALVAILSLIPFALGASRGSVMALIVSAFAVVVAQRSMKGAIWSLSAVIFVVVIVAGSSLILGDAAISRFMAIGEDVEAGSTSAARITIWQEAIALFASNPVFGGHVELGDRGIHPHNLILESLIATGLLGTVPLVCLLLKGVVYARRLIALDRSNTWVAIAYLQSLVGAMFSGGLYASDWLFASLGLLFAVVATNARAPFDNAWGFESSGREASACSVGLYARQA